MTKPCEHLRNTDGKPWCDGIEYFWQDCCKTVNKYNIDSICYNNEAINKQIMERIKDEKLHEERIQYSFTGC